MADENVHAHSVPYFLQAAGLHELDFRKFKRITGRKEVVEEDKEQNGEDQDNDEEDNSVEVKDDEEQKMKTPIEEEASVSEIESQYQIATNFNEIAGIDLMHQNSAPLSIPIKKSLNRSDSSNTVSKAKIMELKHVSLLINEFIKPIK